MVGMAANLQYPTGLNNPLKAFGLGRGHVPPGKGAADLHLHHHLAQGGMYY